MARREWPTGAEHERQKAIALFMDIQFLMVQSFAHMRNGEFFKAAEAMGKARRKAREGQELLRQARSSVEPLDDELADALDKFLADDERGQQ